MDALHSATGRELISFLIGEQEFCVDITSVREIRGFTPATPVPHAPGYMRGVINLRGAVMPVIDLGARLGMTTSEPTARHVIIVANVGEHSVGLVVDAVCETFSVSPERVQPLPDIGGEAMRTVVQGFLQVDERMISLISLDRLLEEAVAETQAAVAA
jgi:purine-binding chemotaxis protein CheW